MDPNESLAILENRTITQTGAEERQQACEDLFDWLLGNGFQPDWDKYPKGTAYYETWKEFCGLS